MPSKACLDSNLFRHLSFPSDTKSTGSHRDGSGPAQSRFPAAEAQVELTHNWDPEEYSGGRNFGHLAYAVDNIYEICQRLQDAGVVINRPPRDGRMAFVRSPDNISIELLQSGDALPPAEPWKSMKNVGEW